MVVKIVLTQEDEKDLGNKVEKLMEIISRVHISITPRGGELHEESGELTWDSGRVDDALKELVDEVFSENIEDVDVIEDEEEEEETNEEESLDLRDLLDNEEGFEEEIIDEEEYNG